MGSGPPPADLEQWLDTLSESGYRLTKPLRAVTEVMATNHRALNPIEIYDLGRELCPSLGLVTVYRTLDKLEEAGLIKRVHQAGTCNGYIAAPRGHQHLLICQSCGRVEYFSGIDLSDLISSVEDKSHYTIHDHWLQLVGTCEGCQ
jgi:Fur family ferric uptake transcriptional regulator